MYAKSRRSSYFHCTLGPHLGLSSSLLEAWDSEPLGLIPIMTRVTLGGGLHAGHGTQL